MPYRHRRQPTPWPPASFLGRVGPSVAGKLLTYGRARQYRRGERLLHEGGLDNHVVLLLRGLVKVTSTASGSETLLAVRAPGDIVGEGAAMTGLPRAATVTACERVEARLVSRETFRQLLREEPAVAHHLAALMSERLGFANRRRADFAACSVMVRLARVLVDLAAVCGQAAGGASRMVDVPLSQRELATMIGAGEDSVQRAARRLKAAGLIETAYGSITVVDPSGLRDISDDAQR